MEQFEIDRLLHDIQDYLNQPDTKRVIDEAGLHDAAEQEDEEAGVFIEGDSRSKMEKFLNYFQCALYAVEVLTIALFTAVMLAPFENWPHTVMFLIGVLLFGIFTISVLLGLQARIRLLFKIENNTREIAVNKGRIADALEKIGID